MNWVRGLHYQSLCSTLSLQYCAIGGLRDSGGSAIAAVVNYGVAHRTSPKAATTVCFAKGSKTMQPKPYNGVLSLQFLAGSSNPPQTGIVGLQYHNSRWIQPKLETLVLFFIPHSGTFPLESRFEDMPGSLGTVGGVPPCTTLHQHGQNRANDGRRISCRPATVLYDHLIWGVIFISLTPTTQEPGLRLASVLRDYQGQGR